MDSTGWDGRHYRFEQDKSWIKLATTSVLAIKNMSQSNLRSKTSKLAIYGLVRESILSQVLGWEIHFRVANIAIEAILSLYYAAIVSVRE